VIETNYNRARNILQEHLDKLHSMADALVKYETIDDSQIREIMEGKPPTPPDGWDSSGLGGGTPGGSPVPPQPAFGSATRNPG
jgi:cell division protease FtsH